MKVNYIYRYISYLALNTVFSAIETYQLQCTGQKSLFVIR